MSSPTKSRTRPITGWMVGAVIAGIVAIVAVIAIVATAGDDADNTPDALEQAQPVTITGTPLPMFVEGGSDPAIGMVAPTVAGASFDGTSLTIAPGKPTLVVFLAHWCPHCQREVPVLTGWAADGDVPAGIDVIGVATSTSPDRPNYPPSEWLEREDFPFPVIADSGTYETAIAYGLSGFPYFVILDATGHVVSRATGEITPDALSELLASALPAAVS